MDKWLKRAVELLTSISFGKSGDLSVVPYYPQKIRVSGEEEKYFHRSIPESFGISSKRLYNMLCELEAEKRSNVHNLIIVAGGEVICECSRDGYSTSTWHLSHSMSKTVTGMAIGFLCDDGLIKVTDKVIDLFPEMTYKDKRFGQMTVEHLLTMKSGVPFAEAGSVTETSWTDAFFGSMLKFAPGTDFSYNSMNSYVLGKIVTRITGKSLADFLEERLFGPLHIKNYFWEIGPEGIEKGGWGLFLSPESWAKIGWMMLSDGVFEGKRILSEEWIDLSSRTHAVAPSVDGDFNYGYQLWVGRSSEEVLFNGMLGQNVWICPKNNIVAVVNSGNNELFQMSATMDIIRKYLGCDIEDALSKKDIRALHERETHFFDSRKFARPLEKKRGILYFLHLRSRTVYDERWDTVCHEYRLQNNIASMLPLFVVGMQNNLRAGIERLSFERAGESLIMSFVEGGDSYSLEIGLYVYKSTVLDFRGEKYMVSAMGEALELPTGGVEYRIELLYPEMPNTRFIRMKITGEDTALVELSEIPNNKIVDKLLSHVPHTNGVAGFAIDLLERRFGEGFIEKKVEEVFTPRLVAVRADSERCDTLLKFENTRTAEESATVRFIRMIVDRFFKETLGIADVGDGAPTQTTQNVGKEKKGFLSSLIDLLKSKRK